MGLVARLVPLAMMAALASHAAAEPTFEREAICRTAIAAIADRDPKAVQVTEMVGEVLLLAYLRPIDNFIWNYRCRIEDNRVIWATDPGRWRDDIQDDKIFFEIVGAGSQLRIILRHADGSTTNRLFDRNGIL
jgi:hypothetical protein